MGDNFASRTYRPGFKRGTPDDCFIKSNYEISTYINSRCNSNNMNMISRIRNSLASGINKHAKLPNLILVVLDDDIITTVDTAIFGVSSVLGALVEWLFNEFTSMLEARKNQLPQKAKKPEYPRVFWAALPHHKNFHNAPLRTKFNLCLASLVKQFPHMRLIKMKEMWDYDDLTLVVNESITPEGEITYWKSLSTSVEFNKSTSKMKIDTQASATVRDDNTYQCISMPFKNPMPRVFIKAHKHFNQHGAKKGKFH